MKRLLVLTMLSVSALLQIQGCGDYSRDEQFPVRIGFLLDSATYPHIQVDTVDMSTIDPFYFKDDPQYLKNVDISSLSINLTSDFAEPRDSSVRFRKIILTMQFDSSYGHYAEYTLGEFDSVSLYELFDTEKVFNIADASVHSVIRTLATQPKMIVRASFIRATDTPVLRSWHGTVMLNFKLTVTNSYGWL